MFSKQTTEQSLNLLTKDITMDNDIKSLFDPVNGERFLLSILQELGLKPSGFPGTWTRLGDEWWEFTARLGIEDHSITIPLKIETTMKSLREDLKQSIIRLGLIPPATRPLGGL